MQTKVIQHVLTLKEGQEICVKIEDINNAFENNFNEAKGETKESEIDRWLKFIYTSYKIESVCYPNDRVYYFRKSHPLQNLLRTLK